jgi:hypothetical protein
MLVRVRDGAAWQAPAGFEIAPAIGNITSGRWDAESLNHLQQDADVLSVEASRPAGIADRAVSIGFVKARAVHAPPLGEEGDEVQRPNNPFISIIKTLK